MGLLRLGIDLMGSDTPPYLLFDAVKQSAEALDLSCTYVVFATQEVAQELSVKHYAFLTSLKTARIEFHIVPEVITMSDEPLSAIRYKKNSSLLIGFRLLKKRLIQAFVSAGNTGALIAGASLSMPRLAKISRPALLATFPTQNGSMAVIDIGGNVSCKVSHLIQFAQMGAAYSRCCQSKVPRIGLLNIGVESKKGTSELREAYRILQENASRWGMDFIGNMEGREIFEDKADVLVTNGFTGNVLLKAIEGTSSFIFKYLLSEDGRLQKPLSQLQQRFNYLEYPGAILCGVDGVIVKSHGNSTAKALFNSIKSAIHLVQNDLVEQIKHYLALYPEIS
jgi:glycerol-3-phosphate acyltransferase PlsX